MCLRALFMQLLEDSRGILVVCRRTIVAGAGIRVTCFEKGPALQAAEKLEERTNGKGTSSTRADKWLKIDSRFSACGSQLARADFFCSLLASRKFAA